MLIVTMFFISFIVLAVYFDRKNMKAATVMHCVLFVFLLSFLLLSADSDLLRIGMSHIIGEELYDELHSFVVENVGVSPTTFGIIGMIWAITIIQSLIAITIAVDEVVRLAAKERLSNRLRKAFKELTAVFSELKKERDICILYCRIRD